MGLRHFLARLLAPDPAGSTEAPTAQPGAWRPPRLSGEERARRDWEGFRERLRTLAEDRPGNGTVVTGRLQMIALDHVKAELGDAWPRIVEKVQVLARRVIERRLRPEDAYLQSNDSTFAILFASLGQDEASFKATAIAREITSLLLGELPDSEDLPATFLVQEVQVAALAAVEDLEGLNAVLDDDKAIVAVDEPPPAPPAEPGHAPDVLQFEYHPVWCQAAHTVAIYQAVVLNGADGREPAPLEPPEDAEAAFELDCAILETILGDVEAMAQGGNTALVIVPVHWRTLTLSGSRRQYLDLCRAAPPGLMSLVGFQIRAMPAGTWQVSLVQHLPRLQPFARFLMVDVELDPLTIRRFQGTGVRTMILDAGGLDPDDPIARWKLETFVRKAHGMRLGVLACRVDSQRQVEVLGGAGVDLMAGPAVAAAVPLPGHPYDLTLSL